MRAKTEPILGQLAMSCGLRNVARTRSLEYLDLLGSMNDFTTRFTRDHQSFTLMPDSIRPNPDVMALMAVEMARYFGGGRIEASRVELDELQLLAEKMEREIHRIAVPETYELEISRFIR